MEKSRKLNTTKFKLVVYWSHRPNGTPFTAFEKSMKWNRKPIPSYDYIHGAGNVTITRHDIAHEKCLEYIKQHWATIDYAELWMNDFDNKIEVCGAVWDKKNPQRTQVKNIHVEVVGNHVYVTGFEGGGIKSGPYQIELYYKKKKQAA